MHLKRHCEHKKCTNYHWQINHTIVFFFKLSVVIKFEMLINMEFWNFFTIPVYVYCINDKTKLNAILKRVWLECKQYYRYKLVEEKLNQKARTYVFWKIRTKPLENFFTNFLIAQQTI